MNGWKLATFGIVTVLVASLGTGLATAWLMRPATPGPAGTVAAAPVRHLVETATVRPRPAVARSAAAIPAASVRPVALGAAPGDCATTGDRVWRIAKPGLIGTLLGAGAGAAGGAIADGGKSAAKGALIGGLAGAALGSAYGAYKTKNECGTILGGSGSGGNGVVAPATRAETLAYTDRRPPAAAAGDRITIYDAGRALPR